MKNQFHLPLASILCMVSLLLVNEATAQEEKKEEIQVQVIKNINGEKEQVTKTYKSIEEMKNDPDLKKIGFDTDQHYSFTDYGEDGKVGVTIRKTVNDGDETVDKNVFIYENDGHIENWLDDEGSRVIKVGKSEIKVEKGDDGEIKVFKDGEELNVESSDFHDGLKVVSNMGTKVKVVDVDEESHGQAKIKEWVGEDGKHKQVVLIGAAETESLDKILDKLELEGIDIDFEEHHGVKVVKHEHQETGKQMKIVLSLSKLVIEDFEQNDEALQKLVLPEKEELMLNTFNYFPNPSEGKFTLSFAAKPIPTKVEVLDLTGKQVYSETLNEFKGSYNNEIDLSHNNPGVFILRMVQGNKALNKKILIE